MTDLYAYSFRSPLSLHEVLEEFRTASSWRWIERDNDEWGEYLSARALPEPHDGMVKLIEDAGRYIINVYLRSDQPGAREAFAGVRVTVLDRLLPAISATDILPTADLES